MKNLNVILFLVISGILLNSCKKEEPAKMPVLSTTPVTNITATTAVSGGNITSDGGATIIASGICYDTETNPTTSKSKTAENATSGQFVSNINGLNPGTTYHVRAYASNAVGTAYGADISFLTLGQAPSSVTLAATNISTTGATLNGTVNPNLLSTVVTFEYGTTISYGQTVTASQSPVTGDNTVNVSSDISGLTIGTAYHFRVKTVNSLGTVYGADMSFTTSGQAPTAITQAACCLLGTGATLNGSVNANYLSTVVTFEYGTTTNYGSTVTASQSPLSVNTSTAVSASVTGLTLGTTYHFRVKAVNTLGTVYGEDLTFTTYNLPVLSTTAPSSITYNTAISGGNISSDGGTAITARGVCWSTSTNPTTALSTKTTDGTGVGSFASSMTGLLPNTFYYVRAYATNIAGTSYGNQLTFTTLTTPPTNGLLVYYPFNGNANDESGNNYNGTVNGPTLTSNRFNVPNSAYHFTGVNSIITSFTGVLGTADRSISFWMKIGSQENGGTVCHYGGGFGTSFSPSIFPHLNVNDVPGGIDNIAELDISDATVDYGIPNPKDDIWHHYVYIFSVSYGTSLNGVRIYRDGILLTEIVHNYHYTVYNVNTSTDTPFSFGAADWENASFSADDLRFYNRVLTNNEIQQLYHEGGW